MQGRHERVGGVEPHRSDLVVGQIENFEVRSKSGHGVRNALELIVAQIDLLEVDALTLSEVFREVVGRWRGSDVINDIVCLFARYLRSLGGVIKAARSCLSDRI